MVPVVLISASYFSNAPPERRFTGLAECGQLVIEEWYDRFERSCLRLFVG
jgi:hypothetical protein